MIMGLKGLLITPATPILLKRFLSKDDVLAVSKITGMDLVNGSDCN